MRLAETSVCFFAALLASCAWGATGKISSSSVPGSAASAADAANSGTEEPSGKIRIKWFIGFTNDPVQVKVQKSVAEDFNASQDRIELVVEGAEYLDPADVLDVMMYRNEGPDIVGPLREEVFHRVRGGWLDLDPLIHSERFDLSEFHPHPVEMYDTPEGMLGLPFAVSPSVVFYNTSLIDATGLAYPPARYGERCRMPDGIEVDWIWNALRELARLMTIDAGGNDVNEPGFDPENIKHYGFTWQFQQHPNYWGSFWAGGGMLAPGGSPGRYAAQVPAAWQDAWSWTYDGIWGNRPFIGDIESEESPEYGRGDPFESGKAAMTIEPYWYACCMRDPTAWEMAPLPSYQGKVGGRIDAETFHIWKGTPHPREAFEALAYLASGGVQKLIVGGDATPAAYNLSLPARSPNQAAWLEIQRDKYPWVKNWDVVLAGLNYPDIPSAEAWMPNFWEAWSRGIEFAKRLRGTAGLDLEAEIQAYLADLTTIFNG